MEKLAGESGLQARPPASILVYLADKPGFAGFKMPSRGEARARLRRVELAPFRKWLEAYRRAWETRDPHAATALYAEDGTYRVTPFLEPLRGRKAIFEYWKEVARTEENIRFAFEILDLTQAAGIAHWSASFVRVPSGLATKLDGIFLIALNEARLCTSLREWRHKQQ
jgi:hypothetical protein